MRRVLLFALLLGFPFILTAEAQGEYLSYDARYFGDKVEDIPMSVTGDEAVHPSVVKFDTAWNGYTYWMAFTPYPDGDDQDENPEIVASNNGTTWVVPTGLTNPIDPSPGDASDFNSDPDLVYNPDTDELWCYYRENVNGTTNVLLRTSSNGTAWSSEQTVIAGINQGLSISIVRKTATDWWMFYQYNGGTKEPYYLQSTNGTSWGNATQTDFTFANATLVPWHFDVNWNGTAFNMLSQDGGVIHGSIYAYSSANGTTWNSVSTEPIVVGNAYRPTFVDNGSNIEIWQSSYTISLDQNWQIRYVNATNFFDSGYTANTRDLNFTFETDTEEFFEATPSGRITWTRSSDQAHSGTYSLKVDGDATNGGILTYLPDLTDKTLSWWIYDNGSTPNIFFRLIHQANSSSELGIGAVNFRSSTHYVYHDDSNAYTTTSVARSTGWHEFSATVNDNSTITFAIDETTVGTVAMAVGSFPHFLLAHCWSTDLYYIDDVTVETTSTATTRLLPLVVF